MKKLVSLLLVLVMALSLAACGAKAPAAEAPSADVAMQYITPEDAKGLLEDSGYVFFDIRKAADSGTSTIPGAEAWDMDKAKEGDAEAGKATMKKATEGLDKKIILVCYSGKRYAQAATNALSAIGYDMSKVYTLEGGFTAWSEKFPELAVAPGEAAAPAVEYPDYVTAPVTIQFWHDRTSDNDLAYLQKTIEKFNSTNQYGITVEEVAIGYLDNVQASVETAVAAGDAPLLADLSANGIPLFASAGVLADMTPYVERDGFDMNNVVKELTDYVYYEDQIVAMPYTRGTAILYYNKDLYSGVGMTEAPKSLEELNGYAKAIYEQSGGKVKGIGYTIEATYYQHFLLASLNGVGFMDADGLGAGCLTDGSLERFLTDWYNWTEEGWCEIPALSGASSAMQEAFYNGQLGAFVSSSNRATSISKKAADAGFELGMAKTVGYGGYSAPLGGGSIGIIESGHSQQEIAAAWEFVKFLMEDEQVASNHIETGVLPTTYSAAEGKTLQDFWADPAYEGYKLSYEQVPDASAPKMSIYTSEWNKIMKGAYSQLIQARDTTPAQILENLTAEAEVLFP